MALGIESGHAQHGNFRAPAARQRADLIVGRTALHGEQPAVRRDQLPGVM